MYREIRIQLEERCEILTKLINKTSERLKSFPAGNLHVKHHKDSVYYYLASDDSNSNEVLLNKREKEYIGNLVQKGYLERVLKAAENELEVITRTKRRYPKVVAEEIYDQLPPGRRDLVKPIIPKDEQFVQKWKSKPYTPKPISDDIPVYKTMKGERVRSKSEQIIADRLYVNGIPYKYECPLCVGDKTIHPDFTILRISERKELYHEHLGKLDDPQYSKDNIPRLNDYMLNGYMLGDKLFLSFETSTTPLDVRVIDQLINEKYR